MVPPLTNVTPTLKFWMVTPTPVNAIVMAPSWPVNLEKGLLRRAQPQEYQAGVWAWCVVEGWGSVHPGVALSKPPQKAPVEVATPRVARSS